ncbi:MAG: SGNH/GDSL hydrolase family protein [Akkermansiaceae bacterium]|nr:SGNH/GDSL hydrolase family protein [Akkermansiaceae bacterium]MCF7730811.1 SGNH/GDSL hydrolase family protein [Akkermansiaceae bacterium]
MRGTIQGGGWLVWLVAAVLMNAAPAAALKILVVGDSMSEEYVFEVPFSAPDSNPLIANTPNWIEILAAHRGTEVSPGSYNSALLSYPDLRNGGYKYNYGVPSFRTTDWLGVINLTPWDLIPGDPLVLLRWSTRTALVGHLDEVDAVVIFLGGNDLKSNYTGVFHDPEPPALLAQVVVNLAEIHDFIRSKAPLMPIIVATVPNVGATPEVASKYNDPARLVVARARVAQMNAELVAMATARGATVARTDQLTDRVFDEVPFHLNGTVFAIPPDPENPPHAVFCKDGFHPATVAQALLADILLDALNRATGRSIPRLTNREILGEVLGLDPDQPYLDWVGPAGGFTADPDGDGLPNLAEYLLGSPPLMAGNPMTFGDDGLLRFALSTEGTRFATVAVEESTALAGWQPVPEWRIEVQPDGWRVLPSGAARNFYRLAVTPQP